MLGVILVSYPDVAFTRMARICEIVQWHGRQGIAALHCACLQAEAIVQSVAVVPRMYNARIAMPGDQSKKSSVECVRHSDLRTLARRCLDGASGGRLQSDTWTDSGERQVPSGSGQPWRVASAH